MTINYIISLMINDEKDIMQTFVQTGVDDIVLRKDGKLEFAYMTDEYLYIQIQKDENRRIKETSKLLKHLMTCLSNLFSDLHSENSSFTLMCLSCFYF